MKLAFLLSLFVSISTVSCAKFNRLLRRSNGELSLRIIGGQEANPLQFPFAVAIYKQTPDSLSFCGGTLLSNRWILTAGQCVDGATLFKIFLGSVKLEGADPNRLEIATSTYFLHPKYNPLTLANDIGLIETRMEIMFNDYLKPIDRLPLSDIPGGVSGTIFGWGQTSDEDAGLSNILRWVRVASVSNEECQITYGAQITENMICAEGNFNEGTCNGDIGGALVQYYTTGHAVPIAVATFLSGNGCESTDPSGFTRVYPFNKWIRNVTGLTDI